MASPSGEYSPFGCKKYPPRDDSKSPQILTTRQEQPQPSSTFLKFLQREHPEKYEAALKQAEKAKKGTPVTPPAPPKANDDFVPQAPPSVPPRSPYTPPQEMVQNQRPKYIRTVSNRNVEPPPPPIKDTGDPVKNEAIRKFQAERDHQKKLMRKYLAGDTSAFSEEQLQEMESTLRDLAQAIKTHGTGEQTTAAESSEYKSNFHEFDYDDEY